VNDKAEKQAMQMHSDRQDSFDGLRPVMISALVALVVSASLVLMDFGPASGSQGHGGGMITAAAVARAGAVALPAAPPAQPR
jgi:hypothetical protein